MKFTILQMDASNAKSGNSGIINVIEHLKVAAEQGSCVLHLPDLTIPGYGVGEEAMRKQAALSPMAMDKLSDAVNDLNCCLSLGMPALEDEKLYNTSVFFQPGKMPVVYFKRFLFGDYEKTCSREAMRDQQLFRLTVSRSGS